MPSNSADLATRAEEIVRELELPSVPIFEDVRQAVSSVIGKPIVVRTLEAAEWAAVPASGLLIESDATAVILTRARDAPLYRRHTALHELGHLLMPKSDCRILEELPLPMLDQGGVRGAIRRAEARGLHVGEGELQAEAIAFALARRLLHDPAARDAAFGL